MGNGLSSRLVLVIIIFGWVIWYDIVYCYACPSVLLCVYGILIESGV